MFMFYLSNVHISLTSLSFSYCITLQKRLEKWKVGLPRIYGIEFRWSTNPVLFPHSLFTALLYQCTCTCVSFLSVNFFFFFSFLSSMKRKTTNMFKNFIYNYYDSRIIFFVQPKTKILELNGVGKKGEPDCLFFVNGRWCVCVCNVCVWNFSLSRGLCVDKYLLDVFSII